MSATAVLALVPGLSGSAFGAGWESPPADLARHVRKLLGEIFRDAAAPRALGKAYLERHPGDLNADLLIRELLGGSGPRDATALARLLSERRVQDFSEGATVVLDGWVLARSEARLCALTVLL